MSLRSVEGARTLYPAPKAHRHGGRGDPTRSASRGRRHQHLEAAGMSVLGLHVQAPPAAVVGTEPPAVGPALGRSARLAARDTPQPRARLHRRSKSYSARPACGLNHVDVDSAGTTTQDGEARRTGRRHRAERAHSCGDGSLAAAVGAGGGATDGAGVTPLGGIANTGDGQHRRSRSMTRGRHSQAGRGDSDPAPDVPASSKACSIPSHSNRPSRGRRRGTGSNNAAAASGVAATVATTSVPSGNVRRTRPRRGKPPIDGADGVDGTGAQPASKPSFTRPIKRRYVRHLAATQHVVGALM